MWEAASRRLRSDTRQPGFGQKPEISLRSRGSELAVGPTHCHVTQLEGTFLNEDLAFHKYQREEVEARLSSLPSKCPCCVRPGLGAELREVSRRRSCSQ